MGVGDAVSVGMMICAVGVVVAAFTVELGVVDGSDFCQGK